MKFREFLTIALLLILSSSAFAITRGGLEDRIRSLSSNEGITAYHSDAILDTFINMAMSYVTSACSCKTEKDTVMVSANTREYALPANFENIKSVFSDNVPLKALTQITSEDIGQFDVQVRADSLPPYFYIEGKDSFKKIGFDYIPVKSRKFNFWYYASAKFLIADDSTSDLPEAFDNAIVYYALGLLWYREMEDGKGAYFQAKADDEILKAKMKMKIPDRIVLPKAVPQ